MRWLVWRWSVSWCVCIVSMSSWETADAWMTGIENTLTACGRICQMTWLRWRWIIFPTIWAVIMGKRFWSFWMNTIPLCRRHMSADIGKHWLDLLEVCSILPLRPILTWKEDFWPELPESARSLFFLIWTIWRWWQPLAANMRQLMVLRRRKWKKFWSSLEWSKIRRR